MAAAEEPKPEAEAPEVLTHVKMPVEVQVIGRYPMKPRRDGRKRFKYHLVNKGMKFRLRVDGPGNLILWTRGFGRGLVRLKLEQDAKARGEVRLDAMPKVSRGVYLTLPRGSFEVTVIPSNRVLFRPEPTGRPPRKGEIVRDWRDREEAAPEPPVVADAGEPDLTPLPPPPPTEEEKPTPAAEPEAKEPEAKEPEAKKPAPDKEKAPPDVEEPCPGCGKVHKKEEVHKKEIPDKEKEPPDAGEEPEDVTVSLKPPPPPPFDPAGPTTFGQWGVFRTWTATPGDPGSMVLATSAEFFKASGFLEDNDEHQRLGTRLTVSGVPMKGLEINAGFSLAVDSNAQSPSKQVQTMGDPFIGVRYGYSVIDWFSLGMGIQGVFPSGTGFSELSTDAICTRILFAFDFRPLPALLLALNTGYHFDNSKRIFKDFNDDLNPLQQFSAGINPHDQVLLNFGAAYQFGPVAPFLEYGTSQAVGGDSPGFGDNPSWLTIGLRAWPLVQHNWHVLAAIDIGMTGTTNGHIGADGFRKAQTPPYNVILALGYDFGATPTQVEIHEIVHTETIRVPVPMRSDCPTVCEAAKIAGRIAGQVVEAETGKPLGGAKVVVAGVTPILLLTEPNEGKFYTCQLPRGPRKLSVYLEGYREKSQVVLITDQTDIPIKIELQPAVGETYGTIKGTVRAITGITLPALVSIPARQANFRAEKTNGRFEQKILTGTFDIMISMQGYVTQRRKVNLGAGDVVILNVELEPEK